MIKPDEYYVMKVVLDDYGVISLESVDGLNEVYSSQVDAYRDIQDYGEPAFSYALIGAFVCVRD